ncbi:MAG: phosphatase PAP2 family protein [Oscillospiraceae bacterium]|nr:phosphatase PAP2 family protein [Oscillospiraceae bacterium]
MDFSAFLGFDRAIFEWVEKIFGYGISGVLTPILVFLTRLGDGGILWIALAIVLMLFKKTRKIGFTVAGAIICMFFFNNVFLKNFFARPRPFDLDVWKDWFVYPEFVTRPDSFSFPSGHSSSAFAAATGLTVSKKARFIVPGYVLAALIAFSRIYVHVHYPTDVIFGALFGIVYGVIAIFVCKFIIKLVNEKTKLTVFKD